MAKYRVKVGEFAQPLQLEGHLGSEQQGLHTPLWGIILHQNFQEQMAERESSYRYEINLKAELESSHHRYLVSGRLDGAYVEEGSAQLEEIKTAANASALGRLLEKQPYHPYWLQLATYRLLWNRSEESSVHGCRLHLLSAQESLNLDCPLTEAEFNLYVEQRLQQLDQHLDSLKKRRGDRKLTAEKLSNPFKQLRQGQQRLMEQVSHTVKSGDALVAQAATGIGKTLGTLLPSLQQALKMDRAVVLLTAKNSQFNTATATLDLLSKAAERQLWSVVIPGKGKLCLNNKIHCHPDHCSFANGFYDRLNNIKSSLKPDCYHPEKLKELGQRHEICPYYLAQHMLADADVVVGDYNQAFNLTAKIPGSMRQLFHEKSPSLLIDEAHNLHSRVMENLSLTLEQEMVRAAQLSHDWPTDVKSCLAALHQLIGDHCRSLNHQLETLKDDLQLQRQTLNQSLALGGGLDQLHETHPLAELLFSLDKAVTLLEDYPECIGLLKDPQSERIQLMCFAADGFIAQCFKGFHARVLFSATLKPFPYYLTMNGLDAETETLEIPSPFPHQHLKILMIPQVSTRYRLRNRDYPRVAEAIERLSAPQQGHYLIFCPSYAYSEELSLLLDERCSWPVKRQEPGMSAQEINSMIESLGGSQGSSLTLAVQGGALAEGVDINSPHLRGVFVVGPALPSPSQEQSLRQQHLHKRFNQGYQYAAIYPAATKAVQAAGRLIRSASKQGLLVLMDERFLEPAFQQAMPCHWFKQDLREHLQTNLIKQVEAFWESQPKNLDSDGPFRD